jgi:two-component system LytT family response regulator
MTIRTIVVDDEVPARNRLRQILGQEPDVEIVSECASGGEAIESIHRLQPDVVFLDVQMPEIGGLDVARALRVEQLPAIIFVTAHDRHAVEAFEVEAVDYLLKPFTRLRLKDSLRRAREYLFSRTTMRADQAFPPAPPAPGNTPYINRFVVKDRHQTLFVKTQDVDYIEAAANYVVLCTAGGNYVLRQTLGSVEASLPSDLFFRISRSVVVNVERIKSLRSGELGDLMVVLQSGRELVMTRKQKDLQQLLQYSGARPQPENTSANSGAI